MTQDEIIEMARQAGFVEYELDDGTTNAFDKRYEAFAKLVAKHTLMNIDPSKFISWQEGFEAGRFAEREACAMLCDEMSNTQANMNVAWRNGCRDAATEIRARGEA